MDYYRRAWSGSTTAMNKCAQYFIGKLLISPCICPWAVAKYMSPESMRLSHTLVYRCEQAVHKDVHPRG